MNSRLLLDSHILLWWLGGGPELTRRAREAIIGAEVVYLSAVSAWELSIKASIGKLRTPDDLEQQMWASGFVPLPITVAHGVAAGKLPRHHRDPFDRMLVAQASLESLTLLTADQRLKAYGIPLLLA